MRFRPPTCTQWLVAIGPTVPGLPKPLRQALRPRHNQEELLVALAFSGAAGRYQDAQRRVSQASSKRLMRENKREKQVNFCEVVCYLGRCDIWHGAPRSPSTLLQAAPHGDNVRLPTTVELQGGANSITVAYFEGWGV